MPVYIAAVEDANATDSNITKLITTTSKNVTAATKANPCQVTMTGHTMVTGDRVSFASVGGMTQLNGNTYTVTYVDANNITIGVDSTSYGTYTSGGTGTILGATQTNPCRVHAVGHGMVAGQIINISGISGMTQLSGEYTVGTVLSVDSFEVSGVNATGYSAYSSSGTVTVRRKLITGATQANPCVITSPAHGRSNGQRIYIDEVTGMTELNGKTFTVANVTTDTFELSGTNSTGFTAYTIGGYLSWFRATIQNAYNNCLPATNDYALVEKTGAASSILGSTNFTWNRNSTTVNVTGTTPVGTISVGDFIGPSTAAGNGSNITYYKVTAVSASAITLENRFWHSDSASTLAETGCKRIVPVAEGTSGAYILTMGTGAVSVTGGYTFANNTAPVRDSETWLKHAFTETSSTNNGISQAGGTLSYINIVDCYYNVVITGVTATTSYVSALSSTLYSFYVQAASTISNIVTTTPISYPCLYVTTNVSFGSNCYAIGNTNVANVQAVGLVENVYSRCTGAYGFQTFGTAAGFKNCDAAYCLDGFRLANFGNYVKNSSAKSCSFGITQGTGVNHALIDNCTLTSNTYGVYQTQSTGMRVYNSTFTNNTYDVANDSFSDRIYLYNCSMNTPTTTSLYRPSTASGMIVAVECTIDDASRYKLLNYSALSGAQNIIPQFIFHNSFGITGELYPYRQITRVSGASPYTQIYWSATYVNEFPMTVLKVAAQQGVGLTIDYDLATPVSLSADLTPKIYLNGELVQSETDIESFTAWPTWTGYQIVIDGADITTDGVIELAFQVNSGTGTLWFKCTGVAE